MESISSALRKFPDKRAFPWPDCEQVRHVHWTSLRQWQFAFAETCDAAADILQLIAQRGAIDTEACDLQHGSLV